MPGTQVERFWIFSRHLAHLFTMPMAKKILTFVKEKKTILG